MPIIIVQFNPWDGMHFFMLDCHESYACVMQEGIEFCRRADKYSGVPGVASQHPP